MSYGDPGYGRSGEAAHVWVSPACPDCDCCTARLCATAAQRGRSCWAVGARGRGVMDVSGCPCAPLRKPGGSR